MLTRYRSANLILYLPNNSKSNAFLFFSQFHMIYSREKGRKVKGIAWCILAAKTSCYNFHIVAVITIIWQYLEKDRLQFLLPVDIP